MRLTASWTHGLTCLFWLGSTILAVLTLLGNFSGTPALRALHLFSIEKNNDALVEYDRYTVGIFGTCWYTKSGQKYSIGGCDSSRIPYYFELKDILVDSQDISEFHGLRDYQSTFQGCMKAAWALLIVFLGINGIGLLLALIGIKWSSVCREAAVQLGIVNLCVILATATLVTVSVNHAVSKFNNDHSGNVVASAHFGGGGIVMVWVLFGFCYLCFAFITVLVKRRNVEVDAEMKHQSMNFDSDMKSLEEGLSTPQVKTTDECSQYYSPDSTLKGTPQSRNRNQLSMHSPAIPRPFTPETGRNYHGLQSPSSPYFQSHNYYQQQQQQQQQRKVSNTSIYTRSTTSVHQPYADHPQHTHTSPSGHRVSSNGNGARQPKVPAQYQNARVARLNDANHR